MNVNRYGSTDQTSHSPALMPSPDRAVAPPRTGPRIYSPDETSRAPLANAGRDAWDRDGQHTRDGVGRDGTRVHDTWNTDGTLTRDRKDPGYTRVQDTWNADGMHTRDSESIDGTRIHDMWSAYGAHTRDSESIDGTRTHDTWSADGTHTRDSVDANGNRLHDSWDAGGKHIHEHSTEDGRHVRDSWDLSGTHIRDTWDENGNHIRDVWDANGKHKRIVWHEKANDNPPATDTGGLTSSPAGRHGPAIRRPVGGDAPTSSPLPGDRGGSQPSEPRGAGNDGLPVEPTGGDDSQPSTPTSGGSRPSGPTGSGGSGQPLMPTGDSGGGAQPFMPTEGSGDGAQPFMPTGGSGGGAQPFMPTGGSGGGAQPSAPIAGGIGDIQAPDNNTGYTNYDQPAPGSARPPALIGFTPEQRGIVTGAYQHVKRMVDSALDKLESGHPDDNFSRWFGNPTQRNVQKVEQVLTHMQHAMSHDQFTFVLGAPHDNSELAHVQFNSPHQINLKPHFFDHAFGANTPEATIAHELSHFPYIGDTKDHLYGPDAVANLAARNSDIATDNAENYGMFIRAQTTT